MKMKILIKVRCKTKEVRILYNLTFGKNISGTFISFKLSSYVAISSNTIIKQWRSFLWLTYCKSDVESTGQLKLKERTVVEEMVVEGLITEGTLVERSKSEKKVV